MPNIWKRQNRCKKNEFSTLYIAAVNITANKNTVPGEPESPFVTSGVRIGTPAVTTRGFGEKEMVEIARWIAECIFDFEASKERIAAEVEALTARFPLYE